MLIFQAIVIITKLSFWIRKPFKDALVDAWEQFKQQGYAEKLKTKITSDSVPAPSDDEKLVAFLYNMVIHI